MSTSLEKILCQVCGSEEMIASDGVLRCKYCHTTHVKKTDAEQILLHTAERELDLLHFENAEDMFLDVTRKYPASSAGYWGLLRAKFSIKYVTDIGGKRIPICHASKYEDFSGDPAFDKAISLAEDEKLRAAYREEAKRIAETCAAWRDTAKDYSYDVFISFKATDGETGGETKDLREMQNLYTYLTEKGYKVFFSPVSARAFAGRQYDAYILNALDTAKVLIVYGSKAEYFSAVWVQTEWARYLRMISKGEKKSGSLLVALDGVDPKNLPRELRSLQALDAGNKRFYVTLSEQLQELFALETKAEKEKREREEAKRQKEAEEKAEAERKNKELLDRLNLLEQRQKQESEEKKEEKYCLACGKKNPTQTKFCMECGGREFVSTENEYEEYRLNQERSARKEAEEEKAKIEREKAEAERKNQELLKELERLKKEKEEAKAAPIPPAAPTPPMPQKRPNPPTVYATNAAPAQPVRPAKPTYQASPAKPIAPMQPTKPAPAPDSAEGLFNTGAAYEKQGNYKTAVDFYQKAAAKGSQMAHATLSLYYQKGYGNAVEKNAQKAYEHMKEAVRLGYPKISSKLEQLEAEAKRVAERPLQLYATARIRLFNSDEKGKQAAFKIFEESAKLGHKEAKIALAVLYQNAFGVPMDETKAKSLYAEANATEQDFVAVTTYLIAKAKFQTFTSPTFTLETLLAQKNTEAVMAEAERIYKEKVNFGMYANDLAYGVELFLLTEQAASSGDQRANGYAYAALKRMTAYAKKYEKEKAFDQALQVASFNALQKSAVEDGLSVAESMLRKARKIMVNAEKLTDLELETVIDLCKESADQGNVSAMYTIGYANELYIKFSNYNWEAKHARHKEAVSWYEKSAKEGYGGALYRLGLFFESGEYSVNKDLEKALSLYKQAVENGWVEAKADAERLEKQIAAEPKNAEEWYQKGKVFEENKDLENAKKCYEEAVKDDHTEAQYALALLHYDEGRIYGNKEKCLELLKKAADKNHSGAWTKLGIFSFDVRNVQQMNMAIEWFKKAEQADHPVGTYWLGLSYESLHNYTDAEKYYEKALSLGYEQAKRALDSLLLKNFVSDLYEADHGSKKWNGRAWAAWRAAKLYELGKGTQKDLDKAEKYYLKAAKAGLSEPMLYMGIWYEEGKNGKKDGKKAAKWYQKTVKKAEKEAKEAQKRLENLQK